jgi:hypothetical protein
MEDHLLNEDKDLNEEQLLDAGAMSDEEEGFVKGYNDEGEIEECEECGKAIAEEKVVKTIAGEKHIFCCDDCVKEFEESISVD